MNIQRKNSAHHFRTQSEHEQTLVFLICAASIHAYYYSAAFMLLTYMQATSIPPMCSLHTCILLQ